MVTKNLNQTWEKIHALIFNVSHFINTLGFVIEKVIFVDKMIPLVFVFDYHVAADVHEKWVYALSDHFLDIGPLHQSGKQLNELQRHALNPMRLFYLILFRLKPPLTIFFFLMIILIILINNQWNLLQSHIIPEHLCKYGEMHVH